MNRFNIVYLYSLVSILTKLEEGIGDFECSGILGFGDTSLGSFIVIKVTNKSMGWERLIKISDIYRFKSERYVTALCGTPSCRNNYSEIHVPRRTGLLDKILELKSNDNLGKTNVCTRLYRWPMINLGMH